jgi:hypothetical protein
LPRAIHFVSDRDSMEGREYFPWPLFWAAYQWTGERRYLDPIFDRGPPAIRAVNVDLLDQLSAREEWRDRLLGEDDASSTESRTPGDVRGRLRANEHRSSSNDAFAWQLTGDKHYLERLYASEIEEMALREYINTEGSLWIDRVVVPHADLQRARLGGVALVRNGTFPGHVVGWSFAAPATEKSVAVLVPRATPNAFDVIAYNLETVPVRATMTAWNVDPGQWEMARGLDTNDDDQPDRGLVRSTLRLERGTAVPLTLAPRAATLLHFRRKVPATPYASRPDLGIEGDDVTIEPGSVRVRVHSLGSVDAPETVVVLRDATGRVRAKATVPALAAPIDLLPKTVDLVLRVPAGVDPAKATVEIDPDEKMLQITRRNDVVRLSDVPPAP